MTPPILPDPASPVSSSRDFPSAANCSDGPFARYSWLAPLGLLCAILIHGAMIRSTWGLTYWDFGDGNYLYISRRLREGITLYKDILAPQPPMHLLIGAWLVRAGDWLWGQDHWFFAFRAFSLILRSLTSILLYLLAFHAFRSRGTALLAAAIWLFLPIGFWWQLGYQSEPLEIAFLLVAILGVWRMSAGSLVLAGLCSALAAHCNMTAAPYFFANALFLLCRRPRKIFRYLIPFAVLYFGIAFAADRLSGGNFLDNVIFNQTGTFPRSDILETQRGKGFGLADYVIEKIGRMSEKVITLEGGFLLLAGLGLAWWSRRREDETSGAGEDPSTGEGNHSTLNNNFSEDGLSAENTRFDNLKISSGGQGARTLSRLRREYLAWTAIGHFLSIGFVSKGGTMDYIFTIGEPMAALFAAAGIAAAWCWLRPAESLRALRLGQTLPFLRLFGFAFLLAIASFNGLRYVGECMKGQACELNREGVEKVLYLIDCYSRPGDALLTPPFYAVVSGRRVAREYSENFIWTIKYMTEKFDHAPGPGMEKARQLGEDLEHKAIPFVILDMAQTGRLPEILGPLEKNYQKIEPKPFQTYNTQITFWIPKDRPIIHTPLGLTPGENP